MFWLSFDSRVDCGFFGDGVGNWNCGCGWFGDDGDGIEVDDCWGVGKVEEMWFWVWIWV